MNVHENQIPLDPPFSKGDVGWRRCLSHCITAVLRTAVVRAAATLFRLGASATSSLQIRSTVRANA
jgi:hypothetical protein